MYAERTAVDQQEALALRDVVAEEQRAYHDAYRRTGGVPEGRGYIAMAPEASEGALFAEGIVHVQGQAVQGSEAYRQLQELSIAARREKAAKALAQLRHPAQTWEPLGEGRVGLLFLYDDRGVSMLELRRRALERMAGESAVSHTAAVVEREPAPVAPSTRPVAARARPRSAPASPTRKPRRTHAA